MTAPHITATIVFHREGAFAVPALSSFRELAETARTAGLVVETQAILDRADETTRHIVAARGKFIDVVKEVSFGDAGSSRNAAASIASGQFLAFLDGDDLWGEQWLCAAYQAATAPSAPARAIWHPECVYCFSERDFDCPSPGNMPHPQAESFYLLQQPSDAPGFNRASLIMNYIWTSNVFTTRELHARYPFRVLNPDQGFGVEDWSWHLETVSAGIPHRIVDGTVHLVRIKQSPSVGKLHVAQSLLPIVPESFVWDAMPSGGP
jgi:glycosyl transferase family 2